MTPDQRRLVQLARRLLNDAEVPAEDPITVVLIQGRAVTVTTAARRPAPRPGRVKLSPLQERILGQLTTAPVTGKALARRVGSKASFYFYSQLRGLVDQDPPLVRRVSSGYCLYANS